MGDSFNRVFSLFGIDDMSLWRRSLKISFVIIAIILSIAICCVLVLSHFLPRDAIRLSQIALFLFIILFVGVLVYIECPCVCAYKVYQGCVRVRKYVVMKVVDYKLSGMGLKKPKQDDKLCLTPTKKSDEPSSPSSPSVIVNMDTGGKHPSPDPEVRSQGSHNEKRLEGGRAQKQSSELKTETHDELKKNLEEVARAITNCINYLSADLRHNKGAAGKGKKFTIASIHERIKKSPRKRTAGSRASAYTQLE